VFALVAGLRPGAAARQDRLMEHAAARAPAAVLASGTVTLRRWRAGDGALAYRLVSESEDYLRPWLPWAAEYTPATARDYVAACERDWAAGTAFGYLVLDAGTPAGSAGLMARIGPGGLEIGYWVHPRHAGRGLATAAAGALTRAALGLPGIDRVEIVHDLSNAASGRVPAKLGYARIGTAPGRFPRAPGECGTAAVWRMTRPADAGPPGGPPAGRR
jgi:ribosomal-protein-serine acetyltransferase